MHAKECSNILSCLVTVFSKLFFFFSCGTICLYCFSKARFHIWTIYLLFGEHFQTQRFLIKHWLQSRKEKLQSFKKWKWFCWSIHLIPKKVHLPINQAHLITFPFTSYQLPVFASLNESPGSQIKCCLQNWKFSIPPGLLEEKYLDPPSLLHPPGLHLPGCSPPPLLPLSSGSCRAGVPPISL